MSIICIKYMGCGKDTKEYDLTDLTYNGLTDMKYQLERELEKVEELLQEGVE